MAYNDGSNVSARAHMMVASTMGAAAFQKGLGGMHAMSHPCGAVLDTHHGLTNAVVMPYVLDFNRSSIEDRLTALARYLDLANPSFDTVLDWVPALREKLSIPNTRVEIVSWHHQAVDRLGEGLPPVAWADDRVVEAMQLGSNPKLLAVQWHPELSAATDPTQQCLFDWLVDLAGAGQRSQAST